MSTRVERTIIRLIVILIAIQSLGWAQGMHERKRIFVFGGGGYAVSKIEGGFIDVGAEVEIFHRVYLRGLIDYYFRPEVKNYGGKTNYAYGFNLSALYRVPLNDLLSLSLNLGGHFTTIHTNTNDSGDIIKVDESYLGLAGGFNFEYQLSNRIYLYLGVKAKYLNAPDPGTWFKGNGGFLIRIK